MLSVPNSDFWLKRLKSLLWGYPELVKMLGEEDGLVASRKQMIEASASSGTPEYILAGGKSGAVRKTRPLELYYIPRPMDGQGPTVMLLVHFCEKSQILIHTLNSDLS